MCVCTDPLKNSAVISRYPTILVVAVARFRIWWSFGRSLSITFVGFLLVSAAHTQVAPGIPTFSTWAGGTAYEDVNVSNRNIFVNIPIRTKLGAVPFQYRL